MAAAMLVLGVALWVAVAQPLQRTAQALDVEYRRLREEQRDGQGRLAALEGRRARARLVTEAAARSGRGPDALRHARLSMIDSLAETPLSDVQLSVSTQPQRAVAALTLVAAGDFEDVVRASGHVVRPGTGLLLEHVAMRPKDEGVDLTVEAVLPEANR